MPSQYLHILSSVTQAETVVVLDIESNFKLKPYFLNIDNYHLNISNNYLNLI
jgi:hypothetical protein